MNKRLRIVAVTVVALLAVALATLRVVGLPPRNQRPGLWLSGDVVEAPVNDWAFTDAFPEIQVQTRTWYVLPHSVTAMCASVDGQLYLASFYAGGPRRLWNRNVARDPRIRVKIGNQLFDRKVIPLADSVETERVFEAYARKYPSWKKLYESPASQRPTIFYWRTEPL